MCWFHLLNDFGPCMPGSLESGLFGRGFELCRRISDGGSLNVILVFHFITIVISVSCFGLLR